MKKLAILGASYLQVPLVAKAREMGIETHVFAWEDGAVAKNIADHFYPVSIVEKEKVLSICKSIKPAGIISIGSDIAMPTVNYVAKELGLTCNSLDCTLVTTNKYEMRRRLADNNISCPQFIQFSSDKGFQADLFSRLNFPLIVKPVDRSGSRGVSLVEGSGELKSAIERAMQESFAKEVIVEEFVNGKEVSVEMISWKGKHHFLAITEKVTTGSPYFVEVEQHEPFDVSDELKEKIIATSKACLSALDVEYGASHSELIIDKNGALFVVEIGARMGGDNIGAHLVEMSTGYDFVKGVIQVALGFPPVIETPHQRYAGIYYITPQAGRVSDISIHVSKYPKINQYEVFVKPGDNINFPVKVSAQRSGYFMYQSDQPLRFTNPLDIIVIKTK